MDLGGVVWKRPSNPGSLRGEDVPRSLLRFSKSVLGSGRLTELDIRLKSR
jgi:hypothetical protein